MTTKMRIVKEEGYMNLHEFVTKCLIGWTITGVTTCGTDCGCLKLRDGETKIKIFFHLHGAKHWTEFGVTIDHIEGCTEEIL